MKKQTFKCACGLKYNWHSDHAAKLLKCLCGRISQIPTQSPDPTTTKLKTIKTDTPDYKACPACVSIINTEDNLCIGCGYSFEQGRRVYVKRKRKKTETELALEALDFKKTKKRNITAAVILAIAVLWSLLSRPMMSEASIFAAFVWLTLWLIAGLATSLLTIKVVWRFIDEQIQTLGPLVLKLAAILLINHVLRAQLFDLFDIQMPQEASFALAFTLAFQLGICFLVVPILFILNLSRHLFNFSTLDSIYFTIFIYAAEAFTFVLLKMANLPG